MAELRPTLAVFRARWSVLDEIWSTSARDRSNSGAVGLWPQLVVESGPNSDKHGRRRSQIGRFWTNFGRVSANFWPRLAEFLPTLVDPKTGVWPSSCPIWPDLADSGPLVVESESFLAALDEIGECRSFSGQLRRIPGQSLSMSLVNIGRFRRTTPLLAPIPGHPLAMFGQHWGRTWQRIRPKIGRRVVVEANGMRYLPHSHRCSVLLCGNPAWHVREDTLSTAAWPGL